MNINRYKRCLISKETFCLMTKVTLFVLLFAFLQVVCVAIIFYVLFYYEMMTVDDLKPLTAFKITLWDILIFSVIEEIVFRKWILNFLVKRKIKYSNAIQAFLFAAAHLDIVKIPIVFLSGLLYGNVYLKEKRVIYNIFLHLVKNFGVVVISELLVKSTLYINLFGLVILLCIFAISIYLIWRKIDIKLFQL